VSYQDFLDRKRQLAAGVRVPARNLPDWLFDFQSHLVAWALERGRGAVFADCGLGKTPMQLVWGQNIVEHTNRPVLIIAPLATSVQTLQEAEKFSIPCVRSKDGKVPHGAELVVTNYERLHYFSPDDFSGVICDESSILKNFEGVTRQAITEFLRRMPYRLLCTATAAPNDYIELGTSSEALGQLGYVDMLTAFFKNDESSLAPLSHSSKWRFKPHAERPFWRWMCGWARALRKPSDLGFDDGAFLLPALNTNITTVASSRPFDGKLFVTPAANVREQAQERRLTIQARCEAVAAAAMADPSAPYVAWCHLNDEADLLEDLIPGARQVAGSHDDDEKEERFEAFRRGQLRVLITKPKIGGFGLNWQHCARMSFFPSHSYEQYYQAVRRCWRFGQTKPVTVDIVTTEGESDVMQNLQRKAEAADRMFTLMVEEMHAAALPARQAEGAARVEWPAWLSHGAA
jgi:hypothetical protein